MVPSDVSVDVGAGPVASVPPVFDEEPFVDAAQRVLLQSQLQALVGTVLRAKWRLDALLGMGGMAAVYAATHRNGHRCAIKMLLPPLRGHAEVVRRFLAEGYAANEVGHPGTVPVTDDDVSEGGDPFLVMELLEGESLETFSRRHPKGAPFVEIGRVGVEVLDVLGAAHGRGIVHRDIKPDNVFLCKDGRVRVLDFGIARMRHGNPESASTRIGAIMGTPAFMPPEQARGRWDEVDARSDLWSVGAMLFVALSGRPLRSAPTANEELLQAMTEPPPQLSSVCREIPLALADVVDRALAFDKAARWNDASEMQAALRTALGEDAPTLHAPPPDSSPPLPGVDVPATRAIPATELILSSTRSEAAAPSPDAGKKLGGRLGAAVAVASIGAVVLGSALFLSRTHARSAADVAPAAVSASPEVPNPGPSEVPDAPGGSGSATAAADDSGQAVPAAAAPPAAPVARPAKPRTNPSRSTTQPGAAATATATSPAPATTPSAPPPDPLSRRR